MTLVIVGASTVQRMDDAVRAFEAGGFARIDELDGAREGDLVLGVSDGGAELLREADRRAIDYVLIHDGEDDRHDGGTFQRAHYRIDESRRGELVEHLRSRERPLITCLAFGYKNGAPADAAIVIDVRFLDNPYWVPELRDLSGRDAAVAEFVMKQPAAGRLLDDVTQMTRDFLPLYLNGRRKHVVDRLRKIEGVDVDFVTRDI